MKEPTFDSDVKSIFILVFMAGFLSAFALLTALGYNSSKDEETIDKVQGIIELPGKKQDFSVRGYKFKATTVCLDNKEIMFIYYRGEPQIINLNKNCGEIK